MTIPILIQLCAALASCVFLLGAIQKNYLPNTHNFIYLALSATILNLGYLLELSAFATEAGFMAYRVGTLGAAFFGPAVFLLLRSNLGKPTARWNLVLLLCAVPLVALVVEFLYPEQRLHSAVAGGSASIWGKLITDQSFFLELHLAYSALVLIAGAAMVLRHCVKEEQKLDIDNALLLAGALAVPLAYPFQRNALMDFTPSAAVVTAALMYVYLRRNRVHGWLTLIRGKVVENLGEGVVLADAEGRYVDANRKAREYFPALRGAEFGTPMLGIAGFPMKVLLEKQQNVEVSVRCRGKDIYLRATSHNIVVEEEVVYTCLTFVDITEIHTAIARLNDAATHDALTGLYNRGAFFSLAGRGMALALRSRRPASVLMIDIDNFKAINDSYGHAVGDEVIRRVARAIQGRLRASDITGRYGGEEFCVFLPDTVLYDALDIAESLRAGIQGLDDIKSLGRAAVTVSIGAAELNPDAHRSLEEVIEEADAMMYRAKEEGRNRVVAASMRSRTGNA